MIAQQPVPQLQAAALLAAECGVDDVLVFRRVTATRWAHLGGLGRGKSWAGVLDVDSGEEPTLAAALAAESSVTRCVGEVPRHVLGAYYAPAAAVVKVDQDVVVVLGSKQPTFTSTSSCEVLRALATKVTESLGDIEPSKRLADELEVLHAVRSVITTTAADLPGTLQHVVAVTSDALSCEVGAIRTAAGQLAVTSSWPGFTEGSQDLATALDILEQRAADGPYRLQDVSGVEGLGPFGAQFGMRSLLAVALPGPVGGVMVFGHTAKGPRGFTDLCRQLATHVADAAGVVTQASSIRDELAVAVKAQALSARTDTLTGLGNRLAWDEALESAQRAVDDGATYTVVTLDIDGLKRINDRHGHAAGDDLLRHCGATLRRHVRGADVAVRLGGDEFALLIPAAVTQLAPRLAALRDALGGTADAGAFVHASVGCATAHPGTSLSAATREADIAMYADKAARAVEFLARCAAGADRVPGPRAGTRAGDVTAAAVAG